MHLPDYLICLTPSPFTIVSGSRRRLREWVISSKESTAFLKTAADAHEKSGQLGTAGEYSLAYVRSLPAGAPGTEVVAVQTMALRLPLVFDFDPLFKLDAGSPPRSTSSPTCSKKSKHGRPATSVLSKHYRRPLPSPYRCRRRRESQNSKARTQSGRSAF
ncbi:hypothetical protein FB451DRAFT_1392180 [Mycena latifolia]|nr:hypothetical protein FB451DRAFT_1392180 [Mycena latifolia]